jgi:hypothetical protein
VKALSTSSVLAQWGCLGAGGGGSLLLGWKPLQG